MNHGEAADAQSAGTPSPSHASPDSLAPPARYSGSGTPPYYGYAGVQAVAQAAVAAGVGSAAVDAGAEVAVDAEANLNAAAHPHSPP
ncbi:hypothetical protein FA13DRAFT_1795644 [Coprinellus micaceus]|uniref:Uncharacterized protein n=1 Tax=Coprinellus micaceus TaxID=71717 RepID=A0A4Y7SX94_COPMI|nr:hypothetical protein FA13DRAFT_1795644 [Coprinellus micaceus]